jgi:hypothetical protein
MHDNPATFSRLLKRILQQSKWGDYLAAGVFVVLASASFWLPSLGSEFRRAHFAQVIIASIRTREIDLRQPQTISLQGLRGEVVLEVAAQRIRVRSSACPNQFCVKQGYVSRSGQMLVCVPNRLVVLISGAQQDELDAITY